MRRFREHLNTYGFNGTPTNVARRVFISVGGMAATLTHKLRLRATIGFFAMPAFRTSPRGISRVNQSKIDSGKLRLIRDEVAKLRESPTAHLRSLTFPEPCALTNPFECFQSDAASGVCGKFNELFRDAVVFVFAEISFPRSSAPHSPANRLRASAFSFASRRGVLQSLAARVVTPAYLLHRSTGEVFAITRCCQPRNSQVNANEVSRGSRRLVRHINGHKQEPLTIFTQHQVTLPFGIRKAFRLVLAHHERDNHATLQGQQTHAVNAFETHHPLVKGHRSVFAKARRFILIALVGFAYLRDAAHRHLRRQSELLTHFLVEKFLQFNLIGGAKFKGFPCQPRRSFIEAGKRFTQGNGLACIRQQLNLQRQLHRRIISLTEFDASCNIAAFAASKFLPMPEGTGFLLRAW